MKAYKVDFLIIWEVKNREFENVCLLKCELERRGYTVALFNTWNEAEEKYQCFDAQVAISPWLYSDLEVCFILAYAPKVRKIVNLQWEQVIYNLDEINNGKILDIKGAARKAVHISWGKKNYEKLVKLVGIGEKNVKLTGSVTLDFLRKKFQDYYQTREQLFRDFKIPAESKTILFISSFTCVNLSKEELFQYEKAFGESAKEYIQLSVDSQAEIMLWFKSFIEKNSEYTIVYRPHPAELSNPELLDIAKKFDNFFVIGDLSIKQWILVSDYIYTWCSTSVAEIFAANKNCCVLRPFEIPYELDIPFFHGTNFVRSFNEFEESLTDDFSYRLDEQLIRSYYCIDDQTPAFTKVCDVLEDVYSNDEYRFNPTSNLALKYKMKLLLKRNSPAFKIAKRISRLIKRTEVNLDNEYAVQMRARNYVDKNEISTVVDKLNRILTGGY